MDVVLRPTSFPSLGSGMAPNEVLKRLTQENDLPLERDQLGLLAVAKGLKEPSQVPGVGEAAPDGSLAV